MPSTPKRRRSGGRPPLQPDAVAVQWTDPHGKVRRGRIVKRTKTTAHVDWGKGSIEPGVKLNDPDLVWLTAADVDQPAGAGDAAAVPAGPLPRSAEPIRPPNNGADQGLMHFDSALGMLWLGLDDDRHLQVDGHALGNLITDLGEGITWRHHDTAGALERLRRIRTQLPDGRAARLVDEAIDRLDAPPRPAPPLPPEAPEPLHTLMADLNAINLVRRGYDRGTAEPFHETDQLAELVQQWMAGGLSAGRFERQLRQLGSRRHESQEGYTEIKAAISQALANSQQWLRRRPPT